MSDDIQVSICVDCLVYVANDETPNNLDQQATDEWIAEFRRINEGFSVVLDAETDSHFSWSSCDTCHTHLGGDRYEASLIPINQTTESTENMSTDNEEPMSLFGGES